MDEATLGKVRDGLRSGKSINAVATELRLTWWQVKKVDRDMDAVAGEPPPKKKPVKRKITPKLKKDVPAPEPDEPEGFDLMISAPTERLDEIIARFTSQEKANAIATVLQQRIDALCGE